MRTLLERFEEKYIPEPNSGCWLWTACCDKLGYGQFRISGKNKKAHRIAYMLAYEEIDETLDCLHKCDVPCCVNPAHLFLGTAKDNVFDSLTKGRWSSKLVPEEVEYIRLSKEKNVVLAKKFGVYAETISRIKCRKTWKYV